MEIDPDRSKLLEEILHLLVSAGYFRARISTLSAFDKLTGGLAWCIGASNDGADTHFDILYHDDYTLGDKIKVGELIEGALRSMECPHPLQAHQIQGLDYKGVYPVVQWIVSRVLTARAELGDELRRYSHLHFQNHFELLGEALNNAEMKESSTSLKEILVDEPKLGFHKGRRQSHNGGKLMPYDLFNQIQDASGEHIINNVHKIEEESYIHQLEKEVDRIQNSIKTLCGSLIEQDLKRDKILSEIEYFHQRINEGGAGTMVEKLISLLELLQSLERKESDFRSYCKQKRSDMQAELIELEKEILKVNESEASELDQSLCDSLEKLNSAKRELAAKLRAILVLKRQLDGVPSQTELIQYERRFAELYVHIQEKLRQTRKHYATYNALVEIKELTLKETSLLNSINSQFQDAMTSVSGRTKLIQSMEGIVKVTQQKLEKVQLGLHAEEKNCTALKEKHATAVAEQRHCLSLLKAFQEECAKNERLRSFPHAAYDVQKNYNAAEHQAREGSLHPPILPLQRMETID